MRGTKRHTCHAAMVPLNGGPRRRAVAGFTLRAELQTVSIVLAARPVTVQTLRRRALVRALEMARLARHIAVAPVKWKRRPIVESAAGRIELGDGWRRTQQDDCRGNRDNAERLLRTFLCHGR
jgi:hypothetical protein